MKILVYPIFDNPYQRLLYNEIKKNKKITITFFDDGFYKSHYLMGLLVFPIRLLLFRLKGYSVFHLHWQHFEISIFNKLISYVLSTCYGIFIILLIKLLGYKLVWTVHNVVPHVKIFLNDTWMTKYILYHSNSVIVHSEDTKKLLINMNCSADKIAIISQGNYIDEYPNTITNCKARTILNVPQNDFIVLFFGIIREYKGIDNLLEIIKETSRVKNLTFIIAGNVLNEVYKKNLVDKINKLNSNIIYHFKFIPNEEIQYYFNAADVVIFPFKKSTNSASILLASSFSRPIIAPKLGNITNFPENAGFLYKEDKEIKNIILSAMQNSAELKLRSKASFSYAKSLSWQKAAESTVDIYKKV